MILSPMQQDDINNMDMNEIRSFMTEGFETTNDHIDNLEIIMNAKFTKVDTQFANVYAQFTNVYTKFIEQKSYIDGRFDEQKSYTDEGFEMTNTHIDNVETGLSAKITDLKMNMDDQFQKTHDKIEILSDLVVKIADKIL